MLKNFDAVRAGELESCTSAENEKVPGWSGVPEMTPVVLSKVRPAGSCPPETAQAYGAVPPVTVIRATYVTETKPPGSIADSMAGTLRLPLLFAGRAAQPAFPIIRAQSDRTKIVDHVFSFFLWTGRSDAKSMDIIRSSNATKRGRHQTTGLKNRSEVRWRMSLLTQSKEAERSMIPSNYFNNNELQEALLTTESTIAILGNRARHHNQGRSSEAILRGAMADMG
jgi:hypothetical protein